MGHSSTKWWLLKHFLTLSKNAFTWGFTKWKILCLEVVHPCNHLCSALRRKKKYCTDSPRTLSYIHDIHLLEKGVFSNRLREKKYLTSTRGVLWCRRGLSNYFQNFFHSTLWALRGRSCPTQPPLTTQGHPGSDFRHNKALCGSGHGHGVEVMGVSWWFWRFESNVEGLKKINICARP